MGKKKVLVAVEDTLWGEVKAAAAREGRNVGLVVENALKLYLLGPEKLDALAPLEVLVSPAVTRTKAEALRELVRMVGPGETVTVGPFPIPVRPETAREKLERESARREWLRTHPEEEGQ